MKVLNLIIKQVYFNAIMDGRKGEEFREVRPTNIKSLLQIDEDGYEKEDAEGNSVPVKYDAIRFFVGYNKDRDTALVEVKSSRCEIFVDDNGDPITYEYGTDKEGNAMVWVSEQVVYDLGRIIDKKISEKSRKV